MSQLRRNMAQTIAEHDRIEREKREAASVAASIAGAARALAGRAHPAPTHVLIPAGTPDWVISALMSWDSATPSQRAAVLRRGHDSLAQGK